ncbi:heme exporter protein CcmD [Rhodospirillaceae bacterium KN72]|uniref:Heme exporter protein D n=1 Tax=Pacificispira spongiicola TaxID=2729598 RepID=A0A7Y0HFT8_9PROT|nr:heme exporter protein CcmD [Pacificispira spongiicola]NMM44948.1 heme exporter protein CcmD [Pacificispira spongiicola]
MFDSFDAFLSMGGYASYVWPSYGICFGLLALLTVQSILVWKRRQRELSLLQGGRARRRDKEPRRHDKEQGSGKSRTPSGEEENA